MAYFLKKTKTKYDVYLQIYESYYDPVRKGSAHRSIKPVGYVKKLIAQGIDDPISYYQREVERMNAERKKTLRKEKDLKIGAESPERSLGYFPFKNIHDGMHVKKQLDLMPGATDFKFNVYELMSALTYALLVSPSDSENDDQSLPHLYEESSFTRSQIAEGLEYIGQEYEKIIDIYNQRIAKKYSFDTSRLYFDRVDFYYDTGENSSQTLCIGLLLDRNQIPAGMKINEETISLTELKARYKISGRTVNADHTDSYLYKKCALTDSEEAWLLSIGDYNSDGNELYRIKEDSSLTEKRVAVYNPNKASELDDEDISRDEYEMIITSETDLAADEIYHAYHNLQEIKESFQIMIPNLQNEDAAKGCLLIMYLSALLLRLLQSKVLHNKFNAKEIKSFAEEFRVIKISERKFVNMARLSPFLSSLADLTGLPLTSYYLSVTDMNKILNHRF